MTDAFAHWLTGFIDGEGCFCIAQVRREGLTRYACRFQIIVREDDAPIIEEIRDRAGFGWIVRRAEQKGRAQIGWIVTSKKDCLALVDLLDRYPLRAKKRDDYVLWRRAAIAWAAMKPRSLGARRGVACHDWSEIEKLHDALKGSR